MRQNSNGFTLIELLVVIGIIALLTSILMPALAASRQQARMVRELAASRQMGQAYIGHALDHKGELITGRTSTPGTVFDDLGYPLTGQAAERWAWRLMRYIDYGLYGSLLVNEQNDYFATGRSDPLWAYKVSVFPSFGLNQWNLGGDQHSPNRNFRGYLTNLDRAAQPSRMVVFSSAATDDVGRTVYGYWLIAPPNEWAPTEYSYPNSGIPSDWGYVHPRWSNRAVVAHLDGHSELLSMPELRDMTRWSDRAARAGDPDWVPPTD